MADVARSTIEAGSDDALAMRARSELQVLDLVVLPIAVEMMNRFPAREWTPQEFSHDKAVFRRSAVVTTHRGRKGMVRCHPNSDVARGRSVTTAFPSVVLRAALSIGSPEVHSVFQQPVLDHPPADFVPMRQFRHRRTGCVPTQRILNRNVGRTRRLGRTHLATLPLHRLDDCGRGAVVLDCQRSRAFARFVAHGDRAFLCISKPTIRHREG